MKLKMSVLLLGSIFFVGCNNDRTNNSSNKETNSVVQVDSKPVPTQYKVLDLTMGMSKQDLLLKGFDCRSLSYSGECQTFTYEASSKNDYNKINNNGTVNEIAAYLDKNNLIYKITISSVHTTNDQDIERFKQTLSELMDNSNGVDESVEIMESKIWNGAHFVIASFTDKARKADFESQQSKNANSAATDIKNFGK